MSTRRVGAVAAAALIVGAAVYYVLVALHSPGPAALDTYGFFVPNVLHAVASVRDGGRGLLWNPFQGCGQPFFANNVTGLLYPPHLLFLVFDVNTALHAVLIVNVVLGGIGMLLLAREYGLGWAAALTAALAFELGDPMAQLTAWSPIHGGPWTWVPWALLCCERLLRRPTRTGIVALAAVVAVATLPGFVLIVFLTYQVIVLRIAWEVVRRGHI